MQLVVTRIQLIHRDNVAKKPKKKKDVSFCFADYSMRFQRWGIKADIDRLNDCVMFYTVSAIFQPYDGGVEIIRLKWKRWRVASTWWKPDWFLCRVLVHILPSSKMSNTAGSFGHLTGISAFRVASRAFAAFMSSCIQQKIKKDYYRCSPLHFNCIFK